VIKPQFSIAPSPKSGIAIISKTNERNPLQYMRNLNGQLDELKKTVSFIDVDGVNSVDRLEHRRRRRRTMIKRKEEEEGEEEKP